MTSGRVGTPLLVIHLVAGVVPALFSIGLVFLGATPIGGFGNVLGHALLWTPPVAAIVGLVRGRQSPVIATRSLWVCALWWIPVVLWLLWKSAGDPEVPPARWAALVPLALLPPVTIALLLWGRSPRAAA